MGKSRQAASSHSRFGVRALERFLEQETASAALLMAAALAALVWANVAPEAYDRFWSTEISAQIGRFSLHEDLRHLVNDLLMAVFFYVVALEIKRELRLGSLRDRRSALVPAAAAIGTMVGAGATYVAVNAQGGDLRGWAIPIATDIAFALGALGLVGRRAPTELRAFMLTLAVVDDLATIVVIAVFFTSDLSLPWLLAGVAVTVAIPLTRRLGLHSAPLYALLAAALWLAVFESGVHATIAGVVLGFLTPAVALRPPRPTAEAIAARHRAADEDVEVTSDTLLETSRLAEEAVPALIRLEQKLHPWSAYVILPIFALANAGVTVSLADLADALSGSVGLGILLGLVVGAPVGGVLLARLVVTPGLGRVPPGLDWAAIASVAPLKGIGFTIAIFISELAFDERALQDEAKLAILVASGLAALIGITSLLVRSRSRGR